MGQLAGHSLSVTLTIALASTALGAQAKPATQDATGVHACSLLTPAEVEKYISRGRPESDPGEMGNTCSYGAGDGSIFVFSGPNAEASFNRTVKAFKKEQEATKPVASLGPGAWVMYPKPENQYQSIGACIHAAAGQHVVFVCVDADKGKPPESATPNAEAVTKLVVSRLR